MRRASAELAERRRASFGSKSKFNMIDNIIDDDWVINFNDFSQFTVGIRSDGTLDPHHAAILFRDSRGVSFVY